LGSKSRTTRSTGRATNGRLRFRASSRLALERQFRSVNAARVRKSSGPITVFARPNGLAHSRLGLSVGRRIGSAVKRNAVKRRLREAFRLNQRELPKGFDFVVHVRAHETMKTAEYADLLMECARALEREWARRR